MRGWRSPIGWMGLAALLGPAIGSFPLTFGHEPAATGASFTVIAEGFDKPSGLAVHPEGFLLLTVTEDGVLHRLDRRSDGTYGTEILLGGLESPLGVAVERGGHVLIIEQGNRQLLRLRKLNGVFAAAPEPILKGLREPRWLVVDTETGGIFLSAEDVRWPRGTEPMPEPKGDLVFKLEPDGSLRLIADRFRELQGLAFDGNANLFAAAKRRRGEEESERRLSGTIFTVATSGGTALPVIQGNLEEPEGLAVDVLGALYLTAKRFRAPRDVAEAEDDDDDEEDARKRADRGVILKAVLKPDGTLDKLTVFAADLGKPAGLAFDRDGHLFAAERRDGRVLMFRAPDAPLLESPPRFTRERTVTFHGTAEPDARITVLGGSALTTGMATASGSFAVDVELQPNTEQTLRFFSTAAGGDGLTSAPTPITITHDDIPPDTQIIAGPSGTLLVTTATFDFTGTDNVTAPGDLEFAWRLDGGMFTAFGPSPSVTFENLAGGEHLFEVKARDQAGNEDPTPAERMFIVVTGPTITGIDPNFGRAGSTVQVVISGFNLLLGTVTTDNPGIVVSQTPATPVEVRATFAIAENARQGETVVSVDTGIGTAITLFTVHPPLPRLAFSPTIVTLEPNGSTFSLDLELSNADALPLPVSLRSDNSAVASVTPTQITIPAGQTTAAVTVTSGSEGATAVFAEGGASTAGASVYVAPPFTGPAFVASQVSVDLPAPPVPATFTPLLAPLVGVDLPPPLVPSTLTPLLAPSVGVDLPPPLVPSTLTPLLAPLLGVDLPPPLVPSTFTPLLAPLVSVRLEGPPP